MTKKIKFALEMADGAKVRTIEDLREKFDIERAIVYFLNGKLIEWLQDRRYKEIVQVVQSLDSASDDFKEKLCAALGAEYHGENVSVTEIETKNAKRNKLKQLTSNEQIIENAEIVAFSQNELDDLIKKDVPTIYLCGDKFNIPSDKENHSYIGVESMPIINIAAKTMQELEERNISFENVRLPEELLRRRTCQPYHVSELFESLLDDKERLEAEKLYRVADKILGNIVFDSETAMKNFQA